MRLTDARKEKDRVQQSIRDALHEHVLLIANRSPDEHWRKSKPAIPLLSVGVAQGTSADDYRVAVRIARHGYRIELLNRILSKHRANDLHVQYVGRVFPLGVGSLAQSSGSSVSHYLTGAGTIGCPVRDVATGAVMLLSNNHVIALENDAVPGDPVIDPGRDDGGTSPANTVGTFSRCVNIDFSGAANVVDCAVADLAPGIEFSRPAGAGFVYDPALPPGILSKTSVVKKIGRSTGLTTGTVTAIEMEQFSVDYQNGPATFQSQFEVTGVSGQFAAHGDSGSLVVSASGAAVGLLFAVSETGVAYVNPIQNVLDLLGIQLI